MALLFDPGGATALSTHVCSPSSSAQGDRFVSRWA
jgi:hypothetical protein